MPNLIVAPSIVWLFALQAVSTAMNRPSRAGDMGNKTLHCAGETTAAETFMGRVVRNDTPPPGKRWSRQPSCPHAAHRRSTSSRCHSGGKDPISSDEKLPAGRQDLHLLTRREIRESRLRGVAQVRRHRCSRFRSSLDQTGHPGEGEWRGPRAGLSGFFLTYQSYRKRRPYVAGG